MGITVGLDHQNISLSKSEICQIKGRIYATDLQYRYVFEVDVQRQKTNLEKTGRPQNLVGYLRSCYLCGKNL